MRRDSTETELSATTAQQLAAWLMQKGIAGTGPMASARDLAREYLDDARYATNEERVDALIERETIKNFATGFVAGVGGVITLPVSIPSALAASWLIQARMAGAIASLYGHDLAAARTQTSVLMSLAGDVAKDAMQGLGIPFGSRLTQRAVDQIPGRALVEINKRIGSRLLIGAGQRGMSSFSRFVPIVGGVVGGALDAIVCRMVGRTAKTLFHRADGAVLEGEVVQGE